jgi:hypothetical protein
MLALCPLYLASPAFAEPFIATLKLDPFSIVSFGDQEIYAFPEGSEIQFEFSAAEGSKFLGFVVRPRGALIEPIPLRRADESLRFTLGQSASGVMRLEDDGRVTMEIDAYVIVTLDHPESPGVKKLPLRLTTESVQAKSLEGDQTIDVSGGRVSGRGVQLVGAATNSEDDYPRPGAPVYVMLSGAFDRLPTLR